MNSLMAEYSHLLADNKWLQLREVVAPERNIHGYVYSHEISCQGRKVCFLPFRKGTLGDKEYLLRKEAVPCWELDTPLYSAFTGSCDPGMTAKEVFLKELKEEAGYVIDESEQWRILELGTSYGTKSTDTIYHLFAIDLTGFPIDKTVDLFVETDLEQFSTNEWLDVYDFVKEVYEPFAYMLMCKIAAES